MAATYPPSVVAREACIGVPAVSGGGISPQISYRSAVLVAAKNSGYLYRATAMKSAIHTSIHQLYEHEAVAEAIFALRIEFFGVRKNPNGSMKLSCAGARWG